MLTCARVHHVKSSSPAVPANRRRYRKCSNHGTGMRLFLPSRCLDNGEDANVEQRAYGEILPMPF